MFYNHELLSVKKGKFALIWLGATRQSIKPKDYLSCDISVTCQELLAEICEQSSRRYSLYLSALLMNGACVVFQLKVVWLEKETAEFYKRCCRSWRPDARRPGGKTGAGPTSIRQQPFELDISLVAEAAGVNIHQLQQLQSFAAADGDELAKQNIDFMRLSLPEDLEFAELRRGGDGGGRGRGDSSYTRFTARQEDITILDTSFALEPSASQTFLLGSDLPSDTGAIGATPTKDLGADTTMTPARPKQNRRGLLEQQQQRQGEELPSLPAEDMPPLDLSTIFNRLKAGENLLFPAGDFERQLCEQQEQLDQQQQRASRRGKRKAEDLPAVEEPPPPSTTIDVVADVEMPRDVTADFPQLGTTIAGGVSIVSAADRQSPPPAPPPAMDPTLEALQTPRTPPPEPARQPEDGQENQVPADPDAATAAPTATRLALPLLQIELQPLQPRRQQQQQKQQQPVHQKPRLLIVDGLTKFNSRRLRWNMEHGNELLKPLALPPPSKGVRSAAMSSSDAASLLLRPGRQPMSERLVQLWEHKREESAHYVPQPVCELERPRISTGGRPSARLSALNLSIISLQSGQNLPRISEELLRHPTVIQSEVAPPEPQPPEQQEQQPTAQEPSNMTPPAPAQPPLFEELFLQPPPPPEDVFASFVAEAERSASHNDFAAQSDAARDQMGPRLSQDHELLMEEIRRSQQWQHVSDQGSEIGEDYRPFSLLCPPDSITRKEAARAFAGLLELAKMRRVRLRQAAPYAEIYVKAIDA